MTVALLVVVPLATTDQYALAGQRTPGLSMPDFAGLVTLVTGKPAPHWGRLPRQESGTAKGKPHTVPAAATRAGGRRGGKPGKGRGQLPPYQTLNRRVRRGRSARRTGFSPKSSRRSAAKSTRTSDYYTNADGSHTRHVFEAPVNYKDGSNGWQPIDTTLAKAQGGRFAEKANSVGVSVAPSAADPALVRLSADGHRVSYGLQGAAKVAPAVSGASARYAGVLPGTDLTVEPTATGMKESLVLNSAGAANSWVFPLDTGGLAATAGKDGSVVLADASGKPVVRIPPAYAFDSKVDRRSGEPATTYGVSYEVRSEPGGGQVLVMTLDESWLKAKDRVFPVTVDPSISLGTATTYAESAIDAGDHSGERAIKTGSWDAGTHKARSFLQFPDAGLDGSGASVSAASLHLFNTWASICQAETFYVAPVTQAWTPPSVTTYPGPSLGSSIGSLTPDVPHACANTTADRTVGDWVSVPLTASAVNAWAQGTGTDHGLGVYASTADDRHWKQFDSANNLGFAPYLSLTYSGAMLPQVKVQSPENAFEAETLTPKLTAVGTIDPSLGTSIKYQFQVTDADGTSVADSGLVASGNWSVPAGKLKWNQTYYWTVQSYDGTNYSPAPQWRTLSTPVPQPAITSNLAQNQGAGFDAASHNYTTQATDAQVASTGPSLEIVRDYNSLDPRVSGAFGAAWSSIADAQAAEQKDTGGTATSVAVTYPDGSTVGFGKNPDGTFTPPQGRFVTFRSRSGGGYELVDKDDTTYLFAQSLGSGQYGISSVTDAGGRAVSFTWSGGHVTTMTSAVSGRALHLAWSTPSGATAPHVATVTTDPATPGDSSTAQTWTYNYTGDRLTSVCPPISSTRCTAYQYSDGSLYYDENLDQGARSFWPLAESSGTTAASAVLANEGTDNATYSGVTLGKPGPLAGGSATAAGFDGTTSMLTLPDDLDIGIAQAESVSMWFKTSAGPGVLLSYSEDPVAPSDSTVGSYTPALYVGSDGKLNADLWNKTNNTPITSAASVADGAWHHVVLAADGATQWVYLDGALVGSKAGVITVPAGMHHDVVGAGYLGGTWPDEPHHSTTDTTGYSTFFNGSIADVAVYGKTLTQGNVTRLRDAGTRTASLLTSVTRPSGKAYSAVAYDGVSGAVKTVTDDSGGSWTVAAPTVTGSSQVYRGAVLGSVPLNYFRLGESAGATEATDEIRAGPATYSNVTLGAGGPFSDQTAASFDGTSSYVELPATDQVQTAGGSVEMWFQMPKGNTAGGVLFDEESTELGAATGNYVPALYVGTDGKLHAKFWDAKGTTGYLVSTAAVNDGKWHHTVLTASPSSQTLYIDGAPQGSPLTAALAPTGVSHVYVGAGQSGGNWANHPVNTDGYFPGSIAEVAIYKGTLSGADVADHFTAGRNSSGLAPLKTVRLTDPGGKTITDTYDPLHGDRPVATVDARGQRTSFGYDSGGFQQTVTDPNGVMTIEGHDVRGNVVSHTTCQDQAAQVCSTSYITYLPDDTSTQLTPDARNDLPATVRDERSSSATDPAYLTTYSYNSAGDLTSETGPPVPGFPHGRTESTTYTDGTTVAAADGGYAPAHLPYKVTSAGGAVTTYTYFRNGDLASETDPVGKVTRYTYDGLGHRLTDTEVTDTYPNGLTTSYTYDGMGRMVDETDPPVTNAVTGAVHTAKTTTAYTPDGETSSRTIADLTGGDASRTVSFSYDDHGQVESQTDAAGKVTSYTHDGYGNVLTETSPLGVTTAYTYDADGNQLTTTLKNYTGDPNNPQTATDLVEDSRAYDPAGRLASITDAMGNTTAYTYTDTGLTVTATRTDPNGQNAFVLQRTTYDAAGNTVSETTGNGATTITTKVDAANRVDSTTLDPGGVNRTTTVSYTPDDHIATTTQTDPNNTATVTSYTYDPLGRMTSKTIGGDGPGRPAGWWKLDQTSGDTVVDSSGSGHAASVGTGVTWADSAAVLPGTSGQDISTTGPVLDTSQSFSVSAWVKLPATPSTGFQTAVSQDGAHASGFYLQYDGPDGKWSFSRVASDADGASGIRALSASAPAAGTWTHLVGVFDSQDGSMKLYVDGAAEGSATDTTPFDATGPLVIGRGKYDSADTDLLNGSVANVQVYQRALSSGDVTALFGKGRGGGTTGSWTSAITKWKLGQRGLPKSMTDPMGNVTSYTYDEDGNLTMVTDPSVTVETGGGAPTLTHPVTMTGYNTFGEQTEEQDPNGNTTVTAYDAEGRQTQVALPDYTPPGSSTPITAAQSWTYDGDGKVTDITDPLQHTTHYTYDQLGDLSTITDPGGGVTKQTYDTGGDLLSTTTPTGAQTQATYDALGRRLTTTTLDRYPDPTTSTTTYSYAASATNPGGAQLASETTEDGATTTYGYNGAGENTKVTDPAGAQTQLGYDFLGRRTKVALADGTATRYHFSTLNKLTWVEHRDTDNSVLTRTDADYNAAGAPKSATDANGHTTTFTTDALGRITAEVQPVDATTAITTSFGYDAAGNRTRYTDGRGNDWNYTYNAWNKLESTVEPQTATFNTAALSTFTTAYDAAGRPVSQTAPGGVTQTASYDANGNLTSQSGSGADAPTATRTFGYDGDGHLLSAATSAIGTSVPSTDEHFTYDDRGLMLTASGSAGASSYAYNGDGLVTSATTAAGTATFAYDSADRPATMDDPVTGTHLVYGYDQLSQLTSIQYGTGGDTRAYTYDHLHRLTGDTLKTTGGATVASIGYGYDPNGNLTSKTTTGFAGSAANTYTYDWANRLTSWNNGTTTTQYGYDASGNRTRVGSDVYTYDARDQLTSDGTNSYTYTARGTLAGEMKGGQNLTFTTDAFGQQITESALQAGSPVTQTYLHDALGRMITDTTSGGGPTHTFAYDGATNDVATDGMNTYTRDAGGTLVGIGSGTAGDGVIAYTDQHDDVVGNFTATGAALSGSATYDPLGNVTANSGLAGHLGYQSGWTDQTTGKVDMAARWYDPAVGQFNNRDTVSPDPVPNSVSANPFAYVGDNPMIGTDPSGHCSWYDLACKARQAYNAWKAWKAWMAWKAWQAWNAARQRAAAAARAARAAAAKARRRIHKAIHRVRDVARRTWHTIRHVYHAIRHPIRTIRHIYHRVKHVVHKIVHKVRHRIHKAIKRLKKIAHKVHTTLSKAAKTVTKVATKVGKATVTFVKHHAATIAGIAAGTLAFAGCEALTLGIGTVGCAAVAGAVGNAVSYGVKAAQTGHFSWAELGKTTLMGAVTGALGGVAGAAGGRVLSAIGGRVLGEGAGIVSEAAEEGLGEGLTAGEEGAAAGGGRAGGEGGGGPGCHSFTGRTHVLMADGKTKPISKIKVGDKVLASVPGGRNEVHTVQRVIVTRTDHDFVDLTIATSHPGRGPPAKLTTTTTHPFYDITQSAFVDAAHLHVGDKLQQPDGRTATITAVRRYRTTQVTYDLTINGLHTYYVEAGTTPLLVHNCGGSNVGGTYNSLKPANQPGFNVPQEINHMPQDASTGSAISYGRGPAIRMDKVDHRQVWSTGQGSRPEPKAWRMMQTDLINSGRIDEAMMNDINDVVTRFPGKYNNAIGDMIGGLAGNAQYQALRSVPRQVHVQLTLW